MYHTYEISFACNNTLKFIEVVAIDMDAAIADVKEAYSGVEFVSATLKG
jgi:hypothetical protein